MSDLIKCPCCNYKAHKANIWPRVAAYEEQLAELDRLRREREERDRKTAGFCRWLRVMHEGGQVVEATLVMDEFTALGLWRDPDAKEQGDG